MFSVLNLVDDLPKPFSKHTMLANADGIVFVIGGNETLRMDCLQSCTNQKWNSVWSGTKNGNNFDVMTAVFYPDYTVLNQALPSKCIKNLI